MDRSSLAPGARSTRLSWRPPEGQEGKRKDPLRLELSPRFSEMTARNVDCPKPLGRACGAEPERVFLERS